VSGDVNSDGSATRRQTLLALIYEKALYKDVFSKRKLKGKIA
jgi:hypothetical protein